MLVDVASARLAVTFSQFLLQPTLKRKPSLSHPADAAAACLEKPNMLNFSLEISASLPQNALEQQQKSLEEQYSLYFLHKCPLGW